MDCSWRAFWTSMLEVTAPLLKICQVTDGPKDQKRLIQSVSAPA